MHRVHSALGFAPVQESVVGAQAVLIDAGVVRIEFPRDRERTFVPQRIGQHERCFTGFDDLDLRHVCAWHG